MRYVGCIEVSDGDDGGRGVEEKLVLRKAKVVGFLRGINNAVGALLQGGFELCL